MCSVNLKHYVKFVRNVMAHAQKPDFVFPRNRRVHLNRWGRQFSRLLAAEVCASALVILDIPRSEVAWEYWLPTPFASFLFTSPPVRHRVPPGSERALPKIRPPYNNIQLWIPVIAQPHTIKVLEHAQNQALRLITGAVTTTPIDAMTFITGNKPIQELIEEKTVVLHEKLLRIPREQYWKT